jgi:hypothetical protein
MSATPPPNPIGGSAAQAAARHELARSQYHRDDPGLVQRFVHWFTRRLDSLFSGGVGGNATLVLIILLAAAVIFAVVRAGRPSRSARAGTGDAEDPLRPLESVDHRRLAAEFDAAGRYAEALREWLRAAVRTIEDRGVLLPQPGRTGAATAREAGPLLPAVAEHLHTATRAFDEVWFGGRPAGPADTAAARAAAVGVVTARIGRAATTGGYARPW